MKEHIIDITFACAMSVAAIGAAYCFTKAGASVKQQSQVTILNVNGCEYIVSNNAIVHKANCTNSFHYSTQNYNFPLQNYLRY